MLDTILNNNRNESASQFIYFVPVENKQNRRKRKNIIISTDIGTRAAEPALSTKKPVKILKNFEKDLDNCRGMLYYI